MECECRYRKFIQGVIHNDGLVDADDNDDEDYVPDPIDETPERVVSFRHSPS